MNSKLLKRKSERMWIEENKDIHALNYWFYRYFTTRYSNWLKYWAIIGKESGEE